MHRRSLVYWDEGFWCRRTVAQRTVRPDGVVVAAPVFDEDLGLPERVEDLGMEWFIFEVPVPLFKNYRSAVADLELDAATAERVITPIDQFDTYPRDAAPWLYRQKGHSHFSESGHRLATEALLEGMFDKTPMSSNVAGPDLAFPGFWRAVLPTSALPSTRQPAPMYIAWHD